MFAITNLNCLYLPMALFFFFSTGKGDLFGWTKVKRKLEVETFLNAGVSLGCVKQGKLSLDVFLVTVLLLPSSSTVSVFISPFIPSFQLFTPFQEVNA